MATQPAGGMLKTSALARAVLLALCACGPLTPSCIHARDAPRPRSVFHDCARICPEMVALPPGSYLMGSQPEDTHQGKDGEEQPQHRVTIAYAFAVGRFEVTRDEYAAFVHDSGLKDSDGCNVHEPPRWPTIMGLNWRNTGFPQTGRDPVVCVSWLEAEAYTRWMSGKTHQHYRLLSEAEWEYADRAGTQTQAYWGDDPKDACQYANGVDATLTERFPQGKWEDRVACHDGHIFTRSAATGRTPSACTTWRETPPSGWRTAGPTTTGTRRPMGRPAWTAIAAAASTAAARGRRYRQDCARPTAVSITSRTPA
jgi:formylglycine-generating enzyme required for sulfatase activity